MDNDEKTTKSNVELQASKKEGLEDGPTANITPGSARAEAVQVRTATNGRGA